MVVGGGGRKYGALLRTRERPRKELYPPTLVPAFLRKKRMQRSLTLGKNSASLENANV